MTSVFCGRGKKSAGRWNCFDKVTQAFSYMALLPYVELNAENAHFQLLECFTVILYHKTAQLQYVNEARQEWKDFLQPRIHCCSMQSIAGI